MKKTLLLFLIVPLYTLTYAQGGVDLTLLFESQPGERPTGLFSHADHMRNLDANGDGTQDLIMTRNNAQGDLDALRVLDMTTNEILFEMEDVQTTLNLTGQDVFLFYGFADPNGDSIQDAIFASNREVVVGVVDASDFNIWLVGLNPSEGTLQLNNIVDLTGDGFEELIIVYPNEQVVRVWTGPGDDQQATR